MTHLFTVNGTDFNLRDVEAFTLRCRYIGVPNFSLERLTLIMETPVGTESADRMLALVDSDRCWVVLDPDDVDVCQDPMYRVLRAYLDHLTHEGLVVPPQVWNPSRLP